MKPKPWIKMQTSTRLDGKLKTMLKSERWIWQCLLYYAAEQPSPGIIEKHVVELAAETADGDVDELKDCLRKSAFQRLITLTCNGDVIDGNITIAFPKYQKRQQCNKNEKKKKNREAVARCRANKKLRENKSGDVICNLDVIDCNHSPLKKDLDLDIKKLSKKVGEPVTDPEQDSTDQFNSPPQIVSQDQPATDDPDLPRVAMWAENLRPGEGWGSWASRIAKMPYSAWWIESAVKTVMGKDRSKFNQRYVEGILRRYANEGGPEKQEPTANGIYKPHSHGPAKPRDDGYYDSTGDWIYQLAPSDIKLFKASGKSIDVWRAENGFAPLGAN